MKEQIEELIKKYQERLKESQSMTMCMTESESDRKQAEESTLESVIDDLTNLLKQQQETPTD